MSGTGKRIRVLIVDDHEVVRRGLAAVLALWEEVELIGEARDGEQAVAAYGEWKPDVVLLDLRMEPVDGIEALRRIRESDPAARVIALTSFVDAQHVLPAVEAGASGYLLKTADPDEIVAAIRAVASGRSMFDQGVMEALAHGVQRRAVTAQLTEREREVLRLVAEGRSNQQIAEALFIGVKTVKTHISSIFAKIDVQDRTQAAVYALRHGLAGGVKD